MLLCPALQSFILHTSNLIFREFIAHLGRFMSTFLCVTYLFLKCTCTIFNYNLLGIFLAALRFGMYLQGESQGYYRANLIFLPFSGITVLHWLYSSIWKLFIYFFLFFTCLWWKLKHRLCCSIVGQEKKMSHHYNFIWAVGKQHTQEQFGRVGTLLLTPSM